VRIEVGVRDGFKIRPDLLEVDGSGIDWRTVSATER